MPSERHAGAMLNLDMVGRLRNDRLIVYGAAPRRSSRRCSTRSMRHAGFELRGAGRRLRAERPTSFFARGLPVLHFFTDLHEDYHRATDDWEKISLDGFDRVTNFTVGIVTALANRPTRLTPEDAPPHPRRRRRPRDPGLRSYLGTIPDMTDNPGGVRLVGVRAGSPAEKAGLRGDDVITKIGRMDVPDLQAMTDALRNHKPGDIVRS